MSDEHEDPVAQAMQQHEQRHARRKAAIRNLQAIRDTSHVVPADAFNAIARALILLLEG